MPRVSRIANVVANNPAVALRNLYTLVSRRLFHKIGTGSSQFCSRALAYLDHLSTGAGCVPKDKIAFHAHNSLHGLGFGLHGMMVADQVSNFDAPSSAIVLGDQKPIPIAVQSRDHANAIARRECVEVRYENVAKQEQCSRDLASSLDRRTSGGPDSVQQSV